MPDWNGFEWFLVAVLVGLMVWATFHSLDRLDDPNDLTVVYVEQLADIAAISGYGRWSVAILRQSGNIHSSYDCQGDARAVIAEVLKTFSRAKISSVAIRKNEPGRLEVTRLFHNHRGRQEGKRVGGAIIVRIADQAGSAA